MSFHFGNEARRGRDRSPPRRSGSPSMMDAVRMPSPPPGFSYDDPAPAPAPRRSVHDYRISSPTDESSYRRRHDSSDSEEEDPRFARTRQRTSKGDKGVVGASEDALRRGADAFLPAKYASRVNESSSERERRKERKKDKLEDDLAYGNSSTSVANVKPSSRKPSPPQTGSYQYAMPGAWEYDNTHASATYAPPPIPTRPENNYRTSSANVLTVGPGNRRGHSPAPPTGRMSSLTVNTGHHSASLSLATGAPASPLLESYHGTYQSMSPMPSPLLLASNGPSDVVEPLSPGLFSDGENGDKKRRRARFHDPEDDAKRLASALKGEKRAPETEPLIEILPGMTHEQIMELRAVYKSLVKTGAERKGVNIAKHIRARLKDEDPTLMKACYATALGKWESEAYWANFWYQGDKTRRELLIESLMGRTNEEIRLIKDAFSDKKYRDSLSLCMKTELKEDKFKKAVLLVLEEQRMDDRDEYGRVLPVDRRLVEDDANTLYAAVRAEKGGETAMLEIVVLRGDVHLREVLKVYEKSYRTNFARDALKKSGNLVGELMAHILNGIINKPVRDALLIHHALTTSKRDSLRRELLISRLVRFHWDRNHLAAIKRAYRERYGDDLSEVVKEGTSGEWGLFCEQLVVTRMPDEVKRFDNTEKVMSHHHSSSSSTKDRDREREHLIRDTSRREKELEHELEKERKREKERDRERERERARDRDRDRDRGRNDTGGLLAVKDHKHRDRSKSRERSRSRRRD